MLVMGFNPKNKREIWMASLVRVYTVKHPAGRPRPEGLDCFTTSRRSEVDRGEKVVHLSLCLSLSLVLSSTRFSKTTDFRASRPREFELPTSSSSSSSSSSSGAFVVFFVSHLYTRAHTSFNAMISREDGAYFII